jgi:hypothetical protein
VLSYGKHRPGATTFFEARCDDPPSEQVPPGDGARISGFRLFGPEFGQQKTGEVGLRIVRCVDIEISNMEIAGWGGAGIAIEDYVPKDDSANERAKDKIREFNQIRIHGNFFHHNQFPSQSFPKEDWEKGTEGNDFWVDPITRKRYPIPHAHANGYGIDVDDGAFARIYENVFDHNRHAIAASGKAGGYIAERNLVLKGGGYHGASYEMYTHIFDVHGTGCYWSPNLCGDAGIKFEYRANAFQYRNSNAIKIRGKPAEQVLFYENVFPHRDLITRFPSLPPGVGPPQERDAAIELNAAGWGKAQWSGNTVNSDSFGQYGVCDFDGDGIDDIFLATGATWWYSSFGEFHWTYLNARTERVDPEPVRSGQARLNQLRLGYFDGDLRCDVLTADAKGQWGYYSGGTGAWQRLGPGAFDHPHMGTPKLKDVQFGRFGARKDEQRPTPRIRTTHALWRPEKVAGRDGKLRANTEGQWFVTPLSHVDWQPAQSSSFPMNQLRFGDFTGNGNTDVLAVVNTKDGPRWHISESAMGSWFKINDKLGDPVGPLFIANMDADDNIDDILRLERKEQQILINGLKGHRITLTWKRSKNGSARSWELWKSHVFEFVDSQQVVVSPGFPSPKVVFPPLGFAGRFGAAPGGGTLVIGKERFGHFHGKAEEAAGRPTDWMSVFPY